LFVERNDATENSNFYGKVELTMTAFNLFSIGHSNIPAARFAGMLRSAGVDAVADVRSVPVSRFCPWFAQKNLAPFLAGENIGYLYFGDTLGGRPRDPALHRDGIADYELMADDPRFNSGLDRLLAEAAQHRLCLMCSEREPLDCHRCLLVARAVAARGVSVGHILHNDAIESHAATERRLLELDSADGDLFTAGLFTGKVGAPGATGAAATGLEERLAAAYRRRARAVAYRAKEPHNHTTKKGKQNPRKKSR
jgi:hypothetical protein